MNDISLDYSSESSLSGLDAMNEVVRRTIGEQLEKMDGLDGRQEFVEALAAKLPGVFRATAEDIVTDLFESAPIMLAACKELDQENLAQVEGRWGRALDVYRMLWVSCHEMGETFSNRHFNVDGYEPPPMTHAQTGLQARACRVALEVLALLRNGLGAGALARARTLHEVATISTILANYGAPDGDHPDLALRYLLHADVVTWLDAVEYQEVAPKLGYEPHGAADMLHMQQERDSAIAKYGDQFGRPNGWAACLIPNQKAPRGFKELELLAGTDHMRSHYSWASHEVHADAKSWVMNHETIGDITFRSTGPSPRGMSDAAQIALIALYEVTTRTLYSAPDFDDRTADVIAVSVLGNLVDRACDAFATADKAGGQPTADEEFD